MKAGKEPSPSLQFTVSSTAKRIEALAGAGHVEQARQLAERLFDIDGSAETKALVNKHVTRAGKPDLFVANSTP